MHPLRYGLDGDDFSLELAVIITSVAGVVSASMQALNQKSDSVAGFQVICYLGRRSSPVLSKEVSIYKYQNYYH